MTQTKMPTLADAFMALLPGATIVNIFEHSWHSATFSGLRVEIQLALAGDAAYDCVHGFAEILPAHEFDLRRYLVADIFVGDIQENPDNIGCCIEALLIDA